MNGIDKLRASFVDRQSEKNKNYLETKYGVNCNDLIALRNAIIKYGKDITDYMTSSMWSTDLCKSLIAEINTPEQIGFDNLYKVVQKMPSEMVPIKECEDYILVRKAMMNIRAFQNMPDVIKTPKICETFCLENMTYMAYVPETVIQNLPHDLQVNINTYKGIQTCKTKADVKEYLENANCFSDTLQMFHKMIVYGRQTGHIVQYDRNDMEQVICKKFNNHEIDNLQNVPRELMTQKVAEEAVKCNSENLFIVPKNLLNEGMFKNAIFSDCRSGNLDEKHLFMTLDYCQIVAHKDVYDNVCNWFMNDKELSEISKMETPPIDFER